MKIWRPKYNMDIVAATAMKIDDLEEAVEFEERTNALPPVHSGRFSICPGLKSHTVR